MMPTVGAGGAAVHRVQRQRIRVHIKVRGLTFWAGDVCQGALIRQGNNSRFDTRVHRVAKPLDGLV